jgi:NitT/TauT family transport system substrate-binding protein
MKTRFIARRALLSGAMATLALAAAPVLAQPTKLRVMVAPTAFEAVYIARDQGIFAKHQLEVEILPGGAPDAMIPLLLNGQIHYGMSSGLATVTAISKGLPVRLALSNLNSGAPATAALLAPVDGPVRTIADLKGRKVGLSSLRNQPHLGMLIATKAEGVEDVSYVEVPAAALIAAAEKGTVDAIYALDPHKSAALASGKFRMIDEVVAKFMGGAPAVTFTAAKDFLDKNPQVAKAFVAAMTEAFEHANANPEAVREVDVKYTKLPPEFVKTRDISKFNAVVDTAALKKMVDAMLAHGWINREVPVSDIVHPLTPTK